MRIVSWNIRAGGGRRIQEIAAQIERWRADVVALQEFRATSPSRWLAEALRDDQGFACQRTTADARRPTSNRILVASRWPLRRSAHQRAPSEPGRWLLVHVAAEHPFSLGVMHVPNAVTGRKYIYHAALLEFARGWRGGPALLIGDTNSGRIGLDEEVPCFSEHEEVWMVGLEQASWRDSFRLLHGDARAYTWYSPNAGNGFRLDEAFINRRLAPRLLDTHYEWGTSTDGPTRRDAVSDHAALIVDLKP